MKEVRDWVDVLFKVVLAGVGVFVGYVFSVQKQQNDDIRLIVEMTSSPERERRHMGASIASEYVALKRIPPGVFVAIRNYAYNSGDPELQAVIEAGTAAAVNANQSVREAVQKSDQGLPIRIYFHIRRPEDRVAAATLEQRLETSAGPDGQPVVIPGIELIPGQQSASILKCFRKAECERYGASLIKLLSDNGAAGIQLSDQSAVYESSTRIRAKHFEAWFAPTS